MTLYVDSSALLKRYLDEADRDRFEDVLHEDPNWVFARHTSIEVRRRLALDLKAPELAEARGRFNADWARARIAELDGSTCKLAAELAETWRVRTLDALHLAAAQRIGGGELPFLTADVRQAQVARALGWIVLGA